MTTHHGAATEWPPWLQALYEAADAQDTAGFTAGFAEDASMIFGNAPVTVGRSAIKESLDGFFETISSMKHNVVRIWELGPDVVLEAVVAYGRTDGAVVNIPAVTTFTRNEQGEVSRCQIYCDMGPVYAE